MRFITKQCKVNISTYTENIKTSYATVIFTTQLWFIASQPLTKNYNRCYHHLPPIIATDQELMQVLIRNYYRNWYHHITRNYIITITSSITTTIHFQLPLPSPSQEQPRYFALAASTPNQVLGWHTRHTISPCGKSMIGTGSALPWLLVPNPSPTT